MNNNRTPPPLTRFTPSPFVLLTFNLHAALADIGMLGLIDMNSRRCMCGHQPVTSAAAASAAAQTVDNIRYHPTNAILL